MTKPDILSMGREELLALDPDSVSWTLKKDEILHIFRAFGGFWGYDYNAADEGRAGKHALLKSGRHSDGFINSKVVLCHDNIRQIMASQLCLEFRSYNLPSPHYVAGIPDGATELGKDVARILGARIARMVKGDDKKIRMKSNIKFGKRLLFVEDFCTKGTGFKEAVKYTVSQNSDADADIMPIELVIINRGGLKEIHVEDVGLYMVASAAEHRISDWGPEECPLCNELGSEAIKPKPKEHPENWEILMNSQD